MIQGAFSAESSKVLSADFIQSAGFMEKAGVSLLNLPAIAAFISVAEVSIALSKT